MGLLIASILFLSGALLLALLFVMQREKTLKAREIQLESIFDTSPTPLLVGYWLDGDYATERVNSAWIKKFQIPEAQVAGIKAGEFSWWVSASDRARLIHQAHAGLAVKEFNVWMRRADGEEFLGSLSSQTRLVKGRQMLVIAYEDISSNYQMQQQLRELNRTLEDRVEQRTFDLKQANTKLEETLQSLEKAQQDLIQSEKLAALGSLVAGVAHELNTPLGNALMSSTTLGKDIENLNHALQAGLMRSTLEDFLTESGQSLAILQRNLQRASGLISSFRQVAVDRTTSQLRQFNLNKVLIEAITLLQPLLKNTQYEVLIDVPESIEITSYPGPLGQVITNLVQNTLLHAFENQEQGLITLKAHLISDQSLVELSVQDNGAGMSEGLQKKVFDPFFTTKIGQGGTGLGLHLVHNIVTGILGGRIQLTSELGQGSNFILTFPSQI
ncbi:PAS domain-containing sensor histidine kinase [Marinospirillum insulare]|uniref:histidine kinase n=1 Tax=Marinospirillum insulare TaxID=217169 RepID=A0ABQ5ZS60_9GAMM|nr:PAS domain-containing sensor histidine kinase [Marinospirillum insulare]GLR62976.1 hypothetical protein GCM10007878_04110 [Marinospirillum insulare]